MKLIVLCLGVSLLVLFRKELKIGFLEGWNLGMKYTEARE